MRCNFTVKSHAIRVTFPTETMSTTNANELNSQVDDAEVEQSLSQLEPGSETEDGDEEGESGEDSNGYDSQVEQILEDPSQDIQARNRLCHANLYSFFHRKT